MSPSTFIIGPDDLILVTGAGGFIGCRVTDAFFAELNAQQRQAQGRTTLRAVN